MGLTLSTVPVVLIIITTMLLAPSSSIAYASESNSKRYSDGYNDGSQAALSDKQNGNPFNPVCDPTGAHTSDGQHTTIYCTGWANGYSATYGQPSSSSDVNTGTQQESSSAVNIRGNNNDVSVQQGQASGSGNDGEGSGHDGGNGHGSNPRCVLLCGAVNVR